LPARGWIFRDPRRAVRSCGGKPRCRAGAIPGRYRHLVPKTLDSSFFFLSYPVAGIRPQTCYPGRPLEPKVESETVDFKPRSPFAPCWQGTGTMETRVTPDAGNAGAVRGCASRIADS